MQKQNQRKYNDDIFQQKLKEYGYTYISGEYKDSFSKLKCYDEEGYIVYVCFNKLENTNKKPRRFHPSNDNTEYNIAHFLERSPDHTCEYVSGKYEGCKSKLLFKCEYGNTFYSTFENVRYLHRTGCDDCLKHQNHVPYSIAKNNLEKIGLRLLVEEQDYKGVTLNDLVCEDASGYKYLITYNEVIRKGSVNEIVNHANPYSIYNINRYLELYAGGNYICVSSSYINSDTLLDIQCKKCGRIFQQTWRMINKRNDARALDNNFTGVRCPHCDCSQLESSHALVLKQVWMHEYPDTIIEDKSCINPITNHVLPTDIVNHTLKIAIEVQSWFHDFEDQKAKDKIKKAYWLNSGYKFYAVDQRDYTILEMIQLFFPYIDHIPEYIDLDYSNKADDSKIQRLLNEGKAAVEVANILGYKSHVIYDAVGYGRVKYPENYKRADYSPVVQLDLNGNYIKRYDKIADAKRETGIKYISDTLCKGRHYSGGYYWVRENDYDSGNYVLK